MKKIERWNIRLNASHTPFEGLINKLRVYPLGNASSKCSVEFTESLRVEDEKSKITIERILQNTYTGILTGLKKMHEKR